MKVTVLTSISILTLLNFQIQLSPRIRTKTIEVKKIQQIFSYGNISCTRRKWEMQSFLWVGPQLEQITNVHLRRSFSNLLAKIKSRQTWREAFPTKCQREANFRFNLLGVKCREGGWSISLEKCGHECIPHIDELPFVCKEMRTGVFFHYFNCSSCSSFGAISYTQSLPLNVAFEFRIPAKCRKAIYCAFNF